MGSFERIASAVAGALPIETDLDMGDSNRVKNLPNPTDPNDAARDTDLSPIQSSEDVTVTDTQVGTVGNGEFLQNSGGSLTGGTVSSEPNVPNWQEDGNSPLSTSSGTSHTFTLSGQYDIVAVQAKVSRSGGRGSIGVRVNGVSTGYQYTNGGGSSTFGSNRWGSVLGSIQSGSGILEFRLKVDGAGGSIKNLSPQSHNDTNIGFVSVSPPLDSITLVTGLSFGDNFTIEEMRVYGVNL